MTDVSQFRIWWLGPITLMPNTPVARECANRYADQWSTCRGVQGYGSPGAGSGRSTSQQPEVPEVHPPGLLRRGDLAVTATRN